tara:strand:+ start:167 stop:412 length:246 start_codon:yes stop_codon:yes gene_type:complete
MIDKKISLGTILTLATIISTFIFTQGATMNRIEVVESDTDDVRKKVMANREKIQNVQIDVARIESKIDEGFKHLEKLLINK